MRARPTWRERKCSRSASAERVPRTFPLEHPARVNCGAMTNAHNPWHAHVYYDRATWNVAERLHQQLGEMLRQGTCAGLVLVGRMYEVGVGPHPKPQFEVQFY